MNSLTWLAGYSVASSREQGLVQSEIAAGVSSWHTTSRALSMVRHLAAVELHGPLEVVELLPRPSGFLEGAGA